ncbi:hypothetical protein HDZ31DRAFT_4508, partial [Schizophyllum fasciatum]
EYTSVFVGGLPFDVDNDRLQQEFSKFGEIESAIVMMDRQTGNSRGFGYVHFATHEQAKKAREEMDGYELDGRNIRTGTATKPQPKGAHDPSSRARQFGDKPSEPSSTLFVGNLPWSATEDSVWGLFGDYGVKNVRLPTEFETGRPKGFGYVEFEDIEGAKKAYTALTGAELDGRNIRLDYSQPRDNSGGGRGGGRGFGGRGGDRGGRGGGRGFGGGR